MITNDNITSTTVLTHTSLALLTWARILTSDVVRSSRQHRMHDCSR